jgi:hypothetical protein
MPDAGVPPDFSTPAPDLAMPAPDLATPVTATLSWTVPTTYTDGTALVVSGYRIYSGTASGVYGTPLDVGKTTSHVFTSLSSGTHYFTVTVYDSSGSESIFSNEVNKVVP